MILKTLLFTISIFMISNIITAQTKSKNIQKEEYTITGKLVTSEVFNKFLSSLKEVPNTSFCKMTTKGGKSGSDMRNKQGIVYEYRVEVENNKNKCSLTKK